jgi:hypothetical protein
MSYGFGSSKGTIELPKATKAKVEQKPTSLEQIAEAGKELGFVSREHRQARRPGPKRTEPQGKLTLTGPKRVLDQLQAKCDEMGGVPYWKAIEDLLNR